jgi:hypothetical protein
MGSAISALSTEQISSISDDVLFQCISAFGTVNDYTPDKTTQIAQRYIEVRIDSLLRQEFDKDLFRHYKFKVDIFNR